MPVKPGDYVRAVWKDGTVLGEGYFRSFNRLKGRKTGWVDWKTRNPKYPSQTRTAVFIDTLYKCNP